MPQGKGTYGSKVGRPSKKEKAMGNPEIKTMGMDNLTQRNPVSEDMIAFRPGREMEMMQVEEMPARMLPVRGQSMQSPSNRRMV
tara:strand:+ start:281 stop:532 length:252 start_codon:yes stop_codon:yes gene_type:complete